MTEVLDEDVSQRGMSEEEQALADSIYAAIQSYSINSERGAQAKEFRVGVSDLGYCSERTKRMLNQEQPHDTDMLKAFIGTALGDHVERAIAVSSLFPDAIIQADVTLVLRGEQRTYNVPGHPDVILPSDGILLDVKTAYGLALARRVGADQQKRFQRHGYAYAAWTGGLYGDLPLDRIKVGNVWLDRSGSEGALHVELEPFDMGVVEEAERWLDDVIYAYLHGETARKEPPREVCAVTCGFYGDCRALDTDVEGLILDPVLVEAARLYREGQSMESEGKSLKKQGKAALKGISGSTGEFTVRWVRVNESQVPTHTRAGYDRLDVKPIR